MPELPEVETTRRGLEPQLLGRRVARVRVRNPRLRWRVPAALTHALPGQVIRAVERRAKYLLLHTDTGTVILHLGMSGSLRVVPSGTPPAKHDHVDIVLDDARCLRLRDPRRFGAVLWTASDPRQHKLLRDIGPEPLGDDFNAGYLHAASRGRKLAVRDFLLNGKIVAGVGNIYANEALFLAGIRPTRPAGRLTADDCARLVKNLRVTLNKAIRAGGTTLRDFMNADGLPGYFQQILNVYGRAGQPCPRCQSPIRKKTLGQRSAFYCPRCQK
jgi:formamidopyrimidine-DNA glycosylase